MSRPSTFSFPNRIRFIVASKKRTLMIARLSALVFAALFLAVFIAPTALMQQGIGGQVQVAERLNGKLTRAAAKEDSKSEDADEITPELQFGSGLAPDTVTGVTYPFTSSSAVVLEDMSSGTTQLVAGNQDDTASAVANIGFEFWFDGVRQTQFSVNANGLFGLGAVAVNNGSSGRTNDFATTTNNPKIATYWDDLCTGTSGKVHYKVIGSAPNRKLVVEWLNMVSFDGVSTFSCLATALGTWQLWLYESTGIIEMVSGGSVTNIGGNGGYSVGIGSSSTSFASVTTTGPTVSYAASNNAQTNAVTAGTKYTFTPNVPAAPTSLTFAPVTGSAIQLNWTDNASNEVGYVIYRSTDGVNYGFVTQTAANAVSFNDTALVPGTTYFYQVYAVTEGALSTALSGSQATSPAGNIVSTGAGGNWSSIATWVGGNVPTSSDNVTIVDGATVTIDVTTATCLNLTVGQGTSGILEFISTPASTLTVNGDVTVAAGGTFTAGTGVLTTHVLNIGGSSTASSAAGSLTVNGTFDMNTTAGVVTNFFGTTNGTLSGAGPTADFFQVFGQKGTNQTAILDVTRVITIASPAVSSSRLIVSGGTIKISSATTATPWFGSNAITGANGKLWINNAGASLQCVGTGTSATGAGSPTITGGLQVDAGTFGYGQGNNTMLVNGSLVVGGAGATINMFGGITFNANSVFTMTAGNINLDPQNVTNIAATSNLLRFSGPNTVNFTGGMITIVDPHAATGTGRALSISTSSGTYNFTGSTIRFGDGVSTTAGSVDGFDIDTFVGFSLIPVGNVIVDNTATNAATRFVRVNTALAPFQCFILGDLTITGSGGSRFDLNGNLVAFGKDIINNGTLDGTIAGSRLYWFGNGVASNYSGTGTSIAPLATWDLDNPLGVTINPAANQIVTLRTNLFRGTNTNANKLTLGNGGATTGVVQIGVTGGVVPGGNFDQAPVFNLGTGGQANIYAQESVGRTTSFEVNPTRILNNMTVDNTNNLTIAGGDLTLSGAAVALALTNGRIITGANTLVLSSGTATVTRTNGRVDGNLRKTYAAAANKTFEVGTANGFSPVAVNVTAGTFPADFTIKAVQGPHPNIVTPGAALQRYWTGTAPAGMTVDLTFNYLATDVLPPTTESNFVVFNYDGTFENLGGTVNTVSHSATVTGLATESGGTADFTLAQPNAPTAAPATISGRVTRPDGSPLGGATINLSGNASARTITNGDGQYRFDNVPTDAFYSVTPGLVNYSFSPASRSFSLVGNMTDAGFTANADASQSANALDSVDYFVRQQYLDFLGREPDMGGWLFWTSQISACGTNQLCINQKRIDVSAAFFASEEFQQTGSFIYRLYQTGLGRQLGYGEFTADRPRVLAGPDLEANREAFANEFVTRPEFMSRYQNATTPESFVDSLLATVMQTTGQDLSAERGTLLAEYSQGADMTHSRSRVLRALADNQSVRDAAYNPSFVLMEYYGYLRRDVDGGGYAFWLDVLNNGAPNNYRGMVCAFLTSTEYQLRFSPVVTHSNGECGQ